MTMSIKDAGAWKDSTPYVKDAGAWKPFAGYVKDAGAWKLFTQTRTTESGSITTLGSGNEIGASTQNFGNGVYGSISGWPGSLGSNRLSDNAAIVTIAEDVIAHLTRVRIQPLSGTLSQNYFASLTANGHTISTSAASFTFSGGIAAWTWSGQLLGLSSSTTYPVSIDF